jgi:hypothetical protein
LACTIPYPPDGHPTVATTDADQSAEAEFVTLPNGWRVGKPVKLEPPINTTEMDGQPCVSADELTLIFGSDRAGGVGGGDLWMAKRGDTAAPFGAPVNLGERLNTSEWDNGAFLSADGLRLYFNTPRPGGHGKGDLWMAARDRTDRAFGDPENLGPTVNTEFAEGEPTLSADDLTLVFVSDRPGGRGEKDLWMATREDKGKPFATPTNLGSNVNGPAAEASPALSGDGLALFFTRYPSGYGSSDLWMCTRSSVDEAFGPAVNLGETVNTPHGEGGAHLSANGRSLYFDSSRPEGNTQYDIWRVPMIPPYQHGDGAEPATAPPDADKAEPDEQVGSGQDAANSLRTWSDGAGHTVEAAFIKLEDEVVHLRRSDGKIAQVPLERLSKQDQAYVAEQAKQPVSP